MTPRDPMRPRSIRVSDVLWAEVVEVAEENGDHVSEVIRAALVAYVRKHRKQGKKNV